MLKGFGHVGMTVSNIDRALAFYVDLLGLKLVMRRQGPGGFDVCFLDAGGGAMLELFGPATGALVAESLPQGRAGLAHLTFNFDDVVATVTMLEAAGVEITERPRLAHNRDIAKKIAFCRDPDGISIELLEI
ncbi:MAG: VOC family protein [Deltaproteobacteria bacterium]